MKNRELDIRLTMLLVAPEVWAMPTEPGVDQLTWGLFWDSVQITPACIGHHVAAHKQQAANIVGRTSDPGEFSQAQARCNEIRRVAKQWMESGQTEFEWLTNSLIRLIASQR